MYCVRKSLWGLGKLCMTTSLVRTVRFHGPFLYQNSFVGVASFGAPYCSTICRAAIFGAVGHVPITAST